MTLAEIRDRVYLLLDKAGAPYFTVDELNEFIDMAQMEFVKTRYKEFELSDKRFQDLVPLVRRLTIAAADITNDLIIISGANSVSVDDDILFVLQLHSDYVIHCGDTTETKTLSVPQLDWLLSKQTLLPPNLYGRSLRSPPVPVIANPVVPSRHPAHFPVRCLIYSPVMYLSILVTDQPLYLRKVRPDILLHVA